MLFSRPVSSPTFLLSLLKVVTVSPLTCQTHRQLPVLPNDTSTHHIQSKSLNCPHKIPSLPLTPPNAMPMLKDGFFHPKIRNKEKHGYFCLSVPPDTRPVRKSKGDRVGKAT